MRPDAIDMPASRRLLFPLSVLKTRRMVLPDATFGQIWRDDGPRGLYKGFSVVICGSIPARMLCVALFWNE